MVDQIMVDTEGNPIPPDVTEILRNKVKELIDLAGRHGYLAQTMGGTVSFKRVDKPYPTKICNDCGLMYGVPRGTCSTWHTETCEVCGKTTSITEPRDFRYPIFPGHELP